MPRLLALTAIAAATALAAAPVATAKPHKPHKPRTATYEVGLATRSINPNPDGSYAGAPVYLGGYGIGGGSPVFEGRAATGILRDGSDVRAIVLGDGKHALAIADVQAQGWFAETKDGPYGITDVRRAVGKATGGRLPASRVIVQRDHTPA